MNQRLRLQNLLPALDWLKHYSRQDLPDDLTAGLVTAVLLVPQGMAYAILAGLPVEVGLYASILPTLIYAFMGTSRTLSVGPVSVTALLVGNALASAGATPGDGAYLNDALLLAAMSGVIFLVLAMLRLDVLVNFLGHPVLSGFTSGAAVLIILSQLQNLTGIDPGPSGLSWESVLAGVQGPHWRTALIGTAGLVFLLGFRAPLVRLLEFIGLSSRSADLVSRAGPLVVIVLLTGLVALLDLEGEGVAIVGAVPAGLPAPDASFFRVDRMAELFPAALIISLIGYVGSISVAKVLAFRRRERINNNQELVALGAANLAASVSGGMPVAGGFGRSVVNFAAGARTQLSGVVTAALVALTALYFTPLFYFLPKAALAAIIIVAVLPLLDWRGALRTWRYDRADGVALLVTFVGVVAVDIEVGLVAGVIVGICAFVWRSSRPHVAIVGRVVGTEHYRNIDRYPVQTWRQLILLRIDRSLFFGNVGYIEDKVAAAVSEHPELKHLVLVCSAVNQVDHTAVETLQQIATNLQEAGVTLHLAEVKGPVMDRLNQSDLVEHLAPGQVFLSTEQAVRALTEEYSSDDRV